MDLGALLKKGHGCHLPGHFHFGEAPTSQGHYCQLSKLIRSVLLWGLFSFFEGDCIMSSGERVGLFLAMQRVGSESGVCLF